MRDLGCYLVIGLIVIVSGSSLQLPIYVYGPETHMTAIVSMALGLKPTHAASFRFFLCFVDDAYHSC